ncbi:hypothetical protein COAQ111491_22170 [Comamonas aquatilis]
MSISRIPSSFLKVWKTVKQVFARGDDFPTPTNIEQCEPPEKAKRRQEERQLRMRHSYRHW